MQKMLVGLVLFLTASLGVTAFSVLSLGDRVDELIVAQNRVGSRPERTPERRPELPKGPAVGAREIQSLRIKVADLKTSHARMKSQLDRALAALADRVVRSEGENAAVDDYDNPDGKPVRFKDGEGNFDITEQAIDYAIQLQKQVDRRRRLGGMVRSVMRRLDSMTKRGEFATLESAERDKVETVVNKFMMESDDLMTRYFREPGPNVREMEAKERRELLKSEREQLQIEAAAEINQMLQDDRGTKIAEAMFYRNWSNRRSSKNVERKFR